MAYEPKPFRDFMHELKWRQGEHFLIAAPTQTGKTTIAAYLVNRRKFVCVLGSKSKDKQLTERYPTFTRIEKWSRRVPREHQKVLLWPKVQNTIADTVLLQREVHKDYLDYINRIGGYCTVVDEYHWEAQFLRLDKELAAHHHQGSTNGNTMLDLTQRPAWIPRITYSSATHALIGRTRDKDDLKALSQLGGVDSARVIETVQRMGRHDLLYLNPMGDASPCIINTRK
jgi:hypothetical protein